MATNPIQPRSAVVTVYGGDYLDRIRHLENQAEALERAIDAVRKAEAETKVPRTSDEVAESVRLVEAHDRVVDARDELVAEAENAALHVRVQALGRREWKALVAEHPPRKAGDGVSEALARSDALSGVNDEAFKEPLVAASLVGPEGVTAEDLNQLSDRDYDRIYIAAFALNRGAAPDPKASLVSRLIPKSDETSS